VDALLDATAPDLRIAFGGAAAGIEGFRATHRQALLTQRVALVGRDSAPGAAGRVTAYTQPEVAAASLLATDLEQARMLVRGTLGALAIDDPPRARLRATLLAFLSTACNYTATAELLTMHKNSVKYRISRAEEERGAPIDDDRLEVELALVACRWFGREVLLPPTGP
jgi:DNA-binding PucR family transcriptional regulator